MPQRNQPNCRERKSSKTGGDPLTSLPPEDPKEGSEEVTVHEKGHGVGRAKIHTTPLAKEHSGKETCDTRIKVGTI